MPSRLASYHLPIGYMLFFVLPDDNTPRGGGKQSYRQVQVLCEAGIDACALHSARGFRYTWFPNDVPIAYAPCPARKRFSAMASKVAARWVPPPDLAMDAGRKVYIEKGGKHYKHIISRDDLVIFPEYHGGLLEGAVTRVPVAVFNQNPHNGFRHTVYPGDTAAAFEPIYAASNFAGVVTVSEYAEDCLKWTFPGVDVHRVICGVDSSVFHPREPRVERSLAYMPRKLASHVQNALCMLRSRGALDGWTISPISGMSESRVAGVLRKSAIFLCTSSEEGFGLPPVEAAMCGCLVVGYAGQAGYEFMDPKYCTPVPQDDVYSLAQSLEAAMHNVVTNSSSVRARTHEFAEILARRYSVDAEKASVIAAWTKVVSSADRIRKAGV